MIEFNYGLDAWQQRNEIFDWCECAFGEYKNGTNNWRFWSSFDNALTKYLTVRFYDESYAALFLLRWGEFNVLQRDETN